MVQHTQAQQPQEQRYEQRSYRPTQTSRWFRENLDLAREGNEAAIDILWKQYGIDYAKGGGRFE